MLLKNLPGQAKFMCKAPLLCCRPPLLLKLVYEHCSGKWDASREVLPLASSAVSLLE